MNYDLEAARLKKDWAENPRWKGVERGYAAEDVVLLRGSLHIEHTLARRGAEKLWKLISDEPFISPGYKVGIAFAILVVMLIWRPQGLLRGRVL